MASTALPSPSSLNEPPSIGLEGAAAGPPPRKRRRRTATGGATDDCFACRNRGAKCDRKRPYCTQCLEIGKECSGYKTTLTWGVGVASRGKLRGLSCPIANKNADGSDPSPVERETKRRKSSISQAKNENRNMLLAAFSNGSASAPIPTTSMEAPRLSPPFAPAATSSMITPSPDSWHFPAFTGQSADANVRRESKQQPRPQQLQTNLHLPYDAIHEPTSGRSVNSYAESEFHSPLQITPSFRSLSFPEPLPSAQSASFLDQDLQSNPTDYFGMNDATLDSYASNTAPPVDSVPGSTIFSPHETMQPFNTQIFDRTTSLHGAAASSSDATYDPFSNGMSVEDESASNNQKDMVVFDTRFSSPFFYMPPRQQALMECYDRHVCPYLVAFDGNENPYRKHVLQLAMHNEALQNAISALAINNLRMRKKDLRRIGFVEEFNDSGDDFNEPTPEETYYKQTSINHLNMQLLDSRAAQDDSVLATLLVLCLFHVCDSGFSKFTTQLAGVQKLLSLRDPSTQSDFTRLIEMFFTWFDVMTSTVNDREVQIKGDSLAMLDFSANLGAMEQFAGCDGRLFKLIARLGRLNLLSQGRPVRGSSGEKHPGTTKQRKRTSKSISLTPADYKFIDGNGWGTPIIPSSDEEDDANDTRADFWTEWREIRHRLQTWHLDPTPTDLLHISEAFRHAALLYTERLGHPHLPTSHPQFQALVTRALYHITSLPITSYANKFLLWPLFIIGTECVREAHRDIVRARCRDLTEESGFFNNLSSLDVLERVWREGGGRDEAAEVRARRRDSDEVAVVGARFGQAFRWRKAMDRVDGEYIVI